MREKYAETNTDKLKKRTKSSGIATSDPDYMKTESFVIDDST